ncbi:MAG: hypothetical protein AAF762_04520 [Pseudomonadota bacterium]
MDDELKAALQQQATQMEALAEAVRTFQQRLDALGKAVGTLDRSVHQTHVTCRAVRDRIDDLSRKVDTLATQTRSANGSPNGQPMN